MVLWFLLQEALIERLFPVNNVVPLAVAIAFKATS